MASDIVPSPFPAAIIASPAPRPTALIPSLTKALAAARDRCRAAHKDSDNTFHHYKYASAEEVIATATDALEGSGLALIPLSERLVVLRDGQQPAYALDRHLLLAHSSGETCPVEVFGWPVIPERGRPLDKAYATALTSSLAYKLRDLLQMPRGNQFDDDVSAADDRNTPVPGTATAPAPVAEAQAPSSSSAVKQPPGNRILDRVVAFQNRLMDAGLCEDGQLFDHLEDQLGQAWVTSLAEDIARACKAFEKQCREKPVTQPDPSESIIG